jgi:hypothetical protein
MLNDSYVARDQREKLRQLHSSFPNDLPYLLFYSRTSQVFNCARTQLF